MEPRLVVGLWTEMILLFVTHDYLNLGVFKFRFVIVAWLEQNQKLNIMKLSYPNIELDTIRLD